MNTLYVRICWCAIFSLSCAFSISCRRAEPQDEAAWIRDHLGKEKVPQDDKGTYYPTHPYDAFKGMDSHVTEVYEHEFSKDEIMGRNTWVMWSGGNQGVLGLSCG